MRSREYYETLAFIREVHQGAEYAGLPYWIHPAAVADVLVDHGIEDRATLLSALLHDVVEDTPTTVEEIEARFGTDVAGIVAEVTDDRRLPWSERKEQQIVKAARFSAGAIAVKAADRYVNLQRDLGRQVPTEARVAHSRRLHDALRARSGEIGGGPALVGLLDSLERTVQCWEDQVG
jgi:guanosine-3',5'-bis(diphosphate) 3'-pyrophosphohydrolase